MRIKPEIRGITKINAKQNILTEYREILKEGNILTLAAQKNRGINNDFRQFINGLYQAESTMVHIFQKKIV
jgi:hypothetical protein